MTYVTSLFFNKENKLETGYLLPLGNVVLFPGITLPVIAGKPRSVEVVESTMLTNSKELIIATIRPQTRQKWAELETSSEILNDESNLESKVWEIENLAEIYPIATLAVIHQTTSLGMDSVQLIVEGLERVEIVNLVQIDPAYSVKFQRLPAVTEQNAVAPETDQQTLQALVQAIKSLWTEAAAINRRFPEELLRVLLNSKEPALLAYQSSILLQQDVTTSQALLEEVNLEKLLRQILTDLQNALKVQRLQGKILGETKKEIDQQQKEFFLRQQLKKIQEELGETDTHQQEIRELRSQFAEIELPEAVEKQVKRELDRLEQVQTASAEGSVIRTYLDWLLEMPWHQQVEDNLDLDNARTILDEDHYGLDKVKKRIIEHHSSQVNLVSKVSRLI